MPLQRRDGDGVWLESRPENGYWQVCWYDPTKRKVRRRSTGSRNRREAERLRVQWVVDGDAGLPGAEAHERWTAAPEETPRIADALTRYLEEHATYLPSREQAFIAAKHLAEYYGDRTIDRLGTAAQQGYINHRWKNGAKERTISRELSVLRAALYHLRDADLRLPPPRDRWLTTAEFRRLLAHCISPHVRLFMLVAAHTAARPGAVLDLTWDRVDLRARVIHLFPADQAPTDKARPTVKMTDELHAALAAAKRVRKTRHVIEYHGRPIRSIDTAFRDAAKAAKLDPAGITPNVLRHTAATWMAQRGVPLREIAHFLGQLPKVTRRAQLELDYLWDGRLCHPGRAPVGRG